MTIDVQLYYCMASLVNRHEITTPNRKYRSQPAVDARLTRVVENNGI